MLRFLTSSWWVQESLAALHMSLPVKTVLWGYEMRDGFPVTLYARYDETLGTIVNFNDEEF